MHAIHGPIHIEEYRFAFKYSLLLFHIIIFLYLSADITGRLWTRWVEELHAYKGQ